MTTTTPPPGSDEAIALGCTCPVLDNGHGNGHWFFGDEPAFVINLDCPLHGSAREAVSPDGENDDEEKAL